MEADIARLGSSIARLVSNRSEEYSAKHGTDLFKATNRTVEGMNMLREPISDFDGYARLIESLYFIFHEGPGGRLGESVPQSFKDINVLRTSLRHDVDHGKRQNVRAKRKSFGDVFAKYAAGSTSPRTLAPERFPIVQASLLKAVETDLRSLKI